MAAIRGCNSNGACDTRVAKLAAKYIGARRATSMLFLPYQTKFSARSMPAVTLALVVLNVLVFFFLQSRDAAVYEAARTWYTRSDLPSIELPRYEKWLSTQPDRNSRERLSHLRAMPAERGSVPALLLMQGDVDFMHELRGRRIVTPADPKFADWFEQRSTFDERLASAFTDRFSLKPDTAQPWRFITHQFLHGDFGHLLGNLIVLLLAGPFVEAAIGRFRFALGYLASGAAAGGLHLLFTPASLIGASGAISGAMAMVAVLYGTRRVPVFYWIGFYFDTARIPALALLPVWIANELYQWAQTPQSRVAYAAHLGGFVAGALIAWTLRPRDSKRVDKVLDAEFGDEQRGQRGSELLRQAQEAAARLDIKRAVRLYRELCDIHPHNVDYMIACFNIALLGADNDELKDAALRVLWSRNKHATDELRKAFLTMSQPRVLQALPVDEQLRLVRRLVRFREDAAALRVLDGLLGDDNLRTQYGRQIADCLLGLYTTYARFGLKQPADNVKSRLSRYFPSPDVIGGLPPTKEAPVSIRSSTQRGPETLKIDLSR